VANELVHEGSAFLNFRHHFPDPKEHEFRWVDVKQLRFSAGSIDDGELQMVECCRRGVGTVHIGCG
jgi:hypothetical protein